jgi:hypothetical protein
MASARKKKCVICDKSLGTNDNPELTTECDHTFHVTCVMNRLVKKKMDCKVCRKESALADALEAYKVTWKRLLTPGSGPIKPEKSASYSNLHEVSNSKSLYL